ncbi:hypothetical protein EDD15DRAFT_1344436 [Pisolithus albus]|nr:hypothetical protein EDD15DRAFT_1344436 [Pisolithus albus]
MRNLRRLAGLLYIHMSHVISTGIGIQIGLISCPVLGTVQLPNTTYFAIRQRGTRLWRGRRGSLFLLISESTFIPFFVCGWSLGRIPVSLKHSPPSRPLTTLLASDIWIV